MANNRLNFLKGLILITVIFFTFFISLSIGANEAFDEFETAVLTDAPKIEIESWFKKYEGKRIEGRGYVVSKSHDTEGNPVISLSTKKDLSSEETINVVVYLREYLVGQKLKAKVGHYVRFIGLLKEIRMSTLVLTEGVVKY